ncbi:PEP-CTERM sorting domain-containing protein [uncultured Deefgea sp.]|uniref:PEP-CTERM sorting domain-containing protein n=1 Tax=uncultured Deefgea sp. TaxID=1304914 RepID=UPI00260D1BDC|nr:PEP-CTERM sorting domain-containing protein [uncultured Deefgea sp.]
MKFNFIALLCLVCLNSHASIVQYKEVIDLPSISVLPGEQQNGYAAIESLFTNTTRSAQDALSGSLVSFFDSPAVAGASERSAAPAAFSAQSDSTPIPAVPEPETYALMGIGLCALLAARRQRNSPT